MTARISPEKVTKERVTNVWVPLVEMMTRWMEENWVRTVTWVLQIEATAGQAKMARILLMGIWTRHPVVVSPLRVLLPVVNLSVNLPVNLLSCRASR